MAGKPAKTAAKKAAPKSAPKTAAKKAAPAAAPAAVPPAPIVMPASTTAPVGAKDPMYPIVDRTPWGLLALILGILGLGGVGTIVAGVVSKRHTTRDIIIGIAQIVVPVLGWFWGLVWGILIFVKGNK